MGEEGEKMAYRTEIFIVVYTIPKGLERGLEKMEIGGLIETIQTIALLRSARILRRVVKT